MIQVDQGDGPAVENVLCITTEPTAAHQGEAVGSTE